MANAPILCCILQILALSCSVRAYTKLSDDSLKLLPDPGDDFDIKTGKLLAPILRTRVPGSPGSTAVLNHFADFFKNDLPQWQISFQNSTSTTPVTGDKQIPFVNLIVTRDPPWVKPGEVGYLTLVAHYDSLMKPESFIGAIDSAAPCAMIMHAARSVDSALTKKWNTMTKIGMKEEDYDDGGIQEHKGIQILFLDGEEAFDVWSDKDSIYGARSLAAEMESTLHPAMSTYHNALSSISLFVLLDLLGSAYPRIPSYFKTTHWAYRHMGDLETRLRSTGKLEVATEKAEAKVAGPWFPDMNKNDDTRWLGGMIGDDHVPFMARGVEVLHLIPSPFPHVWHRLEDDGEHLDIPTCKDWAVLMTAFVAEWMDLEGYMDSTVTPTKKDVASSGKTTSKTEL